MHTCHSVLFCHLPAYISYSSTQDYTLYIALTIVHSIGIKFIISFSRIIFYSIKDLLMLVIQEVCFSPSLLRPDLSHIDTLPFNYSSSTQMYPKWNFSSLSAANAWCLPSHSSLHPSFPSLFCKASAPQPQTAEVPRSQKSLHFGRSPPCSAKIMSNTEEMSVFGFLFSFAGVIHATQMPVRGCALCMCLPVLKRATRGLRSG